MAAYPTLPRRTRIKPARDQFARDVSDAGVPRIVDLTASVLYEIEISHERLSATERNTLTSFWATNKGTVVTVSGPDGEDYDCPLVGEPEIQDVTATRFDVRVQLVGNRA